MTLYKHLPIFLMLLLSLTHCAANEPVGKQSPSDRSTPSPVSSIDVENLADGTEVKNSGLELMNLGLGMNLLYSGVDSNDSVLVVLVHGYQSEGYEWVVAAKGLTEYFGSSYFFRYDWEDCPDVVGRQLAEEIKTLVRSQDFKRVVIFGHSYGGVILTFMAGELGRITAEVHVIAAPLSGFPRLMDQCDNLVYDKMDKLTYPPWQKQVKVFQHKTVHAQDGAFRDLASDPQDVNLPFKKVIDLPPTMDGHRLGHNWSVTWVVDNYLGRPHKH